MEEIIGAEWLPASKITYFNKKYFIVLKDTYMNKWDPWVQTRNNPKHFSPPLSLRVPPLQQVSYHTQHRCTQISTDASTPHRNGAQEFLGPGLPCC